MPEFGATTTTDEVLEGIDLAGRHMMITGASSGLGEESSRALAQAGAEVTMLARDESRLGDAVERVRQQVPEAKLNQGVVDLANLESIRKFGEGYNADGQPVDVLINNAGVMACPQSQTVDGFETQFGTNHLGHFLFTNLLLPKILAGTDPRVVNLSSAAHTMADVDLDDVNFENTPYDPWEAYGRSKTANVLFTRELARRSGNKLSTFAVHPGVIQTNLSRHLPADGPALSEQFDLKTIPAGAATQVWAASSPELKDETGIYLGDCTRGVEDGDPFANGYVSYAYDDSNAAALWSLSEKLVGQTFEQ